MRKTLTYLALIVVSIGLLLTVLLLDTSAKVQVSSSEQVEKADSINALLEHARLVIRERKDPHQISINLAQAHSLAGFLQRARGQAQVDVTFASNSASLQISYFLGSIITDLYVNAEVRFVSAQGLLVDKVRIGSVSIPGDWSLAIAEYVVNRHTQSNVATSAIEWISKVDISEQRILLDLAPSENLLQALKEVKGAPEDQRTQLVNRQIVHYLQFLDSLPRSQQVHSNTSLAYYLSKLMQEALKQPEPKDAALQNEAAIMALAIYAGNYRFSRLVGELSIAVAEMPTSSHAAVLGGREDLSLHFIYSAAIKLLSEQGFSIAVGEFKELMDRGAGGSGYSFTDLAADLSGAHFAALAVDPLFAEHVQGIMAQAPQETLFFPSLLDLDEGLDAKEFTDKYQAVDSPAYQQTLELINRRIAALPVSQLQ